MALCSNELFEVFSYLPAKAIYKFQCTMKSFFNLSQETCFVMKQTQNSLKMNDTCFFLQEGISQGDIILYPLPGNHSSSGISKDVMRFLSNSTRILSSTNGLILCRTTNKIPVELFICNPATKSWLPIPPPKQVEERPHGVIKMILLQRSNACDDYIVFHVEGPSHYLSHNYGCNIYKPKEGEWKAMEKHFCGGGRHIKFNMPVYCNGSIHFISDCAPYVPEWSSYFTPYIMSYNLENGTSTMLTLPKDARRGFQDYGCVMAIFGRGKVAAAHSSICLVKLRRSVFTIWILTDFESNTWQGIHKVRTKEMGLKEKDFKIIAFTVMNGNLLIFATRTRIYSYGLSNENYMKVEEICQHKCKSNNVCFTSYLDTLCVCGPDAASLPC